MSVGVRCMSFVTVRNRDLTFTKKKVLEDVFCLLVAAKGCCSLLFRHGLEPLFQ